jgi:hypothetical protein
MTVQDADLKPRELEIAKRSLSIIRAVEDAGAGSDNLLLAQSLIIVARQLARRNPQWRTALAVEMIRTAIELDPDVVCAPWQ